MILKKVIIFLLIFTGLVITSNNCHAKDLIQWKSYVVGIQPPTGGQELPSEQALQGASVSILNYPSIRATTDSSGMFVLYGIPSNQVHYFKVSKEGYVRTNTAVKMPDFDVDSTVCFSTSQQPCVFPVRLVAVSQEMIGFLQQTAGYTDIDLQRYGVVALPFSRAGEESYDINTQTVLVSINDGDPLTPDRLIKLGDVLIIPNIPPGEARIRIENVDNATIPLITLPVFLGEITIYPVEIVDQSQMGTVKGNVKNEAGDNLPGAIVEAIPEGMQGRYATTTTDANGNYTLNLIQGVYKISAKAQGYARQFYFLVDRPDWASQIWVEPGRTFENINFTLYQAKTITGKVIDSATKSPIPNAWVNAYSQSLMTGAGEATNQNGEYTLVLKPASDYIVSAQAEGYAPIFYNQKIGFNEADYVDISTNDATNINFSLEKGRTIKGKVKDSSGNGMKNVWVDAWSETKGTGGGANTDENGNYTITVSPASDYRVRSNPFCDFGQSPPKCYPEAYYGVPNTVFSWAEAALVDVSSADKENIDITVTTGYTISGTVKDKNNQPIANAYVNAFSPYGGGSAQTDANGVFTISVRPGSGYRVEAFAHGYPRVLWKGEISNGEGINDETVKRWEDATEINVNQNITGIDFVLSQGVTVSGTVTDSSGKPISGVWVNVWNDDGIGSGDQSKGNGTFSVVVPEGYGYRISAYSPEYPNVFYKTDNPSSCSDDCTPDKVSDTYHGATVFNFTSQPVQYQIPVDPMTGTSETVTLPALPEGAKGVDIVFKGTGGTIEGKVTAYGRPVPGVWVTAYSEQCAYGVGESTKADGTYKLKVTTGENGCSYKVEAFSDIYIHQFYNGKYDWMEADEVDVTPNNPNRTDINFNLSKGNPISGTVKDSTGKALSDIWVSAYSETAGIGGGAVTDRNGNYTINLRPARDYIVSVWHPDYPPQTYNQKSDPSQGDPVDNTQGPVTGIDFVLSAGCTISGTVTKSGGGVPEPDMFGNRGWVYAWSESAYTGAGAPVRSDGKYQIKVECLNDYKVQVFHPNYMSQYYNGKTTYEEADLVDASTNPTNINFTLSSGGVIKGKITKSGGGPVANAWVNAYSESMMFGMGEATNADGEYEIKGLIPASDYIVSVWSDEFASVFYKENANGTSARSEATLIDLSQGGTKENINIVLETAGSIKGTIKVLDGTLSGNIFVNAFSESLQQGRGESLKFSTGATQANFEIKGLAPATDYRVSVFSDIFGNKFYKEGTDLGTRDYNSATQVTVQSGSSVQLQNAITLTRGASISGKVYTDQNKTMTARSGWVQAINPESGEYNRARIKGDGSYEIKGLADGTLYTVQALVDGYSPVFFVTPSSSSLEWQKPNVVASEAGTRGIDLILSKGYTISGRVIGPDNKPVQYAFVGVFGCGDQSDEACNRDTNLDDNPFFFSPIADRSGNYRTPPLAPGKYLLLASSPELGRAFYQDNQGNKIVAVTNKDLSGLDIKFESGKGKITGTITNLTGKPIDEIQVMVYRAGDGKLVASKSKETVAGNQTFVYDIIVDPGTYKVRAVGHRKGGGEGWPKSKFYNNKPDKQSADMVSVEASSEVRVEITLE